MFNLLKVAGGSTSIRRTMSTSKLDQLRVLMANVPVANVPVQAYIIPTDDQHQSEYISPHDSRREFICGFDGSAGTAVVMENEANLWTDGRYWEQASKQLEPGWTLQRDGAATTLSIGKYLAKNLPIGSKVGVDPLMMSYRMWNTINTDLSANDCSLFPVRANLIDRIWTEQPSRTSEKCHSLAQEFAGQTIAEKAESVRTQMANRSCAALVVTALDEVACE